MKSFALGLALAHLAGCQITDDSPTSHATAIDARGIVESVEVRLVATEIEETITIATDGVAEFSSRVVEGDAYAISLVGAPGCVLADNRSGIAGGEISVALTCRGARFRAIELVELEQAKRDLAPLVLGVEANAHRARPDAAVEKHLLFHDGIPIVNLRFHVRRLADGTRLALDPVRPPPDLGERAVVRSRREHVAEIARKRHPDLPLDRIEPVYLAELEAGAIRALKLVWRVTMRPAVAKDPRMLAIDDRTGDVLDDESAAAPVSIQGLGYYFKDVTIEGSEQEKFQCLRDPGYSSGTWSPCEDVSIDPMTRVGVATYFTTNDASVYMPVATTDGIIGTGQPPQDETDWGGMATQAVDAHVGALRAIQFYREMFGRTFIGSLQGDSMLVVVDPQFVDNGRAETAWSLLRIGRRSNPLALPKPHPDVLMHEYTHLLLASEGFEYGGDETRALHEGIADIFGILMQPTIEAGVFATIVAPPQPWAFPSEETVMVGPQRRFRHPSDDQLSVDAYGDRSPDDQLSFKELLGIQPHRAAGPLRRWFYFLVSGAAPYVPNTANLDGSVHLPGGMHGIGVDPAARILYRTITDAKFADTTPTYRELRDGMLDLIAEQEQCSMSYKAVRNAWAAVNVGPAVDRARPSVSGTVSQIDATYVRVTVQAQDQGDGLGFEPKARILVDGVQLGLVRLEQTSSANGVFTYQGAVNLPLGLFTSFGLGPMAVALSVRDFCGNEATDSAGNLTIDLTGPGILEFRDVTSTYAWATNPDGSLRVSPLTLSSPLRTVRVATTDQARVTDLTLGTPQHQETWSFFNATSIEDDFPIDLSTSDAGAALSVLATDRFDNVSTRTLPSFVDATPPSSCSFTCFQPTNSERLVCDVAARDAQSGVFGVRVRTVAPSPQPVPLGGPAALRADGTTSLVADDWHWYYADRPHGDANYTFRHGPGELFEAQLRTDAAFAPGAPDPLPFGDYTLQLECRDFWGNTSQAIRHKALSQRPTLSLTEGPMDDQGHYSYSLRASDDDGIWKFVIRTTVSWPNQGSVVSDTTVDSFCGTSDNRPLVCDRTIQAQAQPGQKIRLWVVAFDGDSASTGRALEMTLPVPPPPQPPASTVYDELEDGFGTSCGSYAGYHGSLNTVPETAIEIRGRWESTLGNGCPGDLFKIPYTSGRLRLDMDNGDICDVNGVNGCMALILLYEGSDARVWTWPDSSERWLNHGEEVRPISWVVISVPGWTTHSGDPYRIRIIRD